jgi:hypothetical protein
LNACPPAASSLGPQPPMPPSVCSCRPAVVDTYSSLPDTSEDWLMQVYFFLVLIWSNK